MLLLIEMMLWSLVLPVVKRLIPIRRLARLMWSSGGSARRSEQEEAVLRHARRLSRLRPSARANCLERSLLAYRFLSRVGSDPRLILGMHRDGQTLAGHAWITVGGKPVYESREALDQFVPIVEFGRGGTSREFRDDAIAARLPAVWR
jgi:hypothetical protein